MGQDPLWYGHPDLAERILRAALAAHLPTCQRMLDMPSFRPRPGVLARAPGTTPPHPDPDRRVRPRRADAHGRDEPADPDQPRPDDQRGREARHGERRACELTTPPTSSPLPVSEHPRPVGERRPPCA